MFFKRIKSIDVFKFILTIFSTATAGMASVLVSLVAFLSNSVNSFDDVFANFKNGAAAISVILMLAFIIGFCFIIGWGFSHMCRLSEKLKTEEDEKYTSYRHALAYTVGLGMDIVHIKLQQNKELTQTSSSLTQELLQHGDRLDENMLINMHRLHTNLYSIIQQNTDISNELLNFMIREAKEFSRATNSTSSTKA